ncbi:hypothetical protein, partial [Bacillus velezensis]|uniref:hypothetical protein n=1 Tax=Bacillus velezensis TaxID=492670 RepID=UPI001C92D8D7
FGQFDQHVRNRTIQISPYSTAKTPTHNPPITYTLHINPIISHPPFSLPITYSPKQYQTQTIQPSPHLLKTTLHQLIPHSHPQHQIHLTPTDISLKGITIGQLDQFLQQTTHLGH